MNQDPACTSISPTPPMTAPSLLQTQVTQKFLMKLPTETAGSKSSSTALFVYPVLLKLRVVLRKDLVLRWFRRAVDGSSIPEGDCGFRSIWLGDVPDAQLLMQLAHRSGEGSPASCYPAD